MKALRGIAVGLALGAVLVTGGCGGAKRQASAKARYVAQAEQICRGAQAQTSPLISQLSSAAVAYAQGGLTPARARQLAPAAGRLQSTAAALLARLRALPPPPGDASRISRFLTPTAELVRSISAASGALTLGDTAAAVNALQQALASGQSAQAAATAYGLRQCAAAVLPPGL
jgi:hypothetical protein